LVLSWVADDGYPVNVDIAVEISPDRGTIRFIEPPGFHIASGSRVAFTGTHIRPLRGGGFDQRRHLTVWGVAAARPRGRFVALADRVWAWDGESLPLPAVYERDLPKARRYFARLSAARGVTFRPRVSPALLARRATRAPFLAATLVPVALGFAIAARTGYFDLLAAVLTLLAACAAHLGLNAASDIFDTIGGSAEASTMPARLGSGSRVIQNALVPLRGVSALAAACYLFAGSLGLVVFLMRGSVTLAAIVALGLFVRLAFTLPPFRLVYRGVGGVATAIGFGPVMLLGSFVVQSRGAVTLEALVVSVPVGLLVAMVLYISEIPDRRVDAKAHKLTLPVRWTTDAVIRGFDACVGASFAVIVAGVAVGVLPIPMLLTLAAVPLALSVHAGLVVSYDDAYALMPTIADNIRLNLVVGLLSLVAYLVAIVDQLALGRRPFLW
jgi:1,4-dihydroxy-2-naphthoate octaprenyltransferase